jgi:hypothetical protein
MKKLKKRYHTEAQIIAAIDNCKARAKKKLERAQALDDNADKLFKAGDPEMVSAGNLYREEASALRDSANRLVNRRARELGQLLAIFRTPQLPAIDNGDKSVSI